MKKYFLILLVGYFSIGVNAQDVKENYLSPWCVDLNILGGVLNQNIANINFSSAYPASLNSNISNLKASGGSTFGADLQLGYFFDKKRHFGIGTGIMYLQQNYDITMDNFHVEYRSLDYNMDTFRQVLTSKGAIKETVSTSNINVPLVFKYRTQISGKWGLAIDAGALFNLQISNSYTTNASFDYEAIYKIIDNGNGKKAIYDYAPIADINDWKITQEQYNKDKKDGLVLNYFNALKTQGYNVGLGISPKINNGNVNYNTGSVGFILQPSATYKINENLYVNGGFFLIIQSFSNNASPNYKTTDKVGDYNSVLNGITQSDNTSYGVNVGLRYMFTKKKEKDNIKETVPLKQEKNIDISDMDGDGIPDKEDSCISVFGIAKFNGCPDTDGDGIPDKDDACPYIKGLAKFHGCPDSDGDGVPDNEDLCPYVAGLTQFHGCPDTDGDGIPDKDDACPYAPGLAENHGCPDRDGDGVFDDKDKCPCEPGPLSNAGCPVEKQIADGKYVPTVIDDDFSTLVLFDVDKATILHESFGVLDKVVDAYKKHKGSTITIDGHTDNTGNEAHNRTLSVKRAFAVKDFLVEKGILAKDIAAAGYGSERPVASNDTPEGRMKNRRCILNIVVQKK